jgi:hypothetical protein
MKRSHNEKRNLLKSILQGNAIDVNKKLKRLRHINDPQIILISASCDGKYYSLSMNTDIQDKELSLLEIEKLKEDHTVLFLPKTEGKILPDGKITLSKNEIEE